MRCAWSRRGSIAKWSPATALHQTMPSRRSISVTPLGDASIAERNCVSFARSSSSACSRTRSAFWMR